ncbi:xylulokinase [Streptosporangium sp. NPDC023615]|uniref:xylulokinase n=1 Tax=Streptosporangium sp. NPDC023615 TaxID=3154794 RepID=UPI00342D1C35
MPVVAGIDSSTQSCTVELRDADDGALLGTGRAPHPATHPPLSEQDPAAWWRALTTALALACRDAGVRPASIDAVSVTAQCHGLVALDAAGQVLRPAKLWNDTTSASQAAGLVARYGARNWVRATGLTPTAALTVTKLAWLAEHEPGNLRRLTTVLVPHDWLTYRLTGERVTDRSDASGTGYYAAFENRWRTDLLTELVSADVDWDAAVPRVLGPAEPAGHVLPEVAAELGLRPGVLVGPGGGDQHLGAVGLGLRTGDVAYSLGTSGVVLSVSAHPVFDSTGWVDGVADATGGYLPLVCTLNSTKVTDTFARLLGVDVETLGHLALAADPARARPTLVAYLDGERSPDLPNAQGVMAGLTTASTREGLALSVFESVIFGLVRGHQAIDAAGVPTPGEVVAVGGGARSLAYRQVLADVLGRPVITRDAPEASARGACVQGAAVLSGSGIKDVRDAWRPPLAAIVPPRPGDPAALMERYLLLAEQVRADNG